MKMVVLARRRQRWLITPPEHKSYPENLNRLRGILHELDTLPLMANSKQTRLTSSGWFTWGGPVALTSNLEG